MDEFREAMKTYLPGDSEIREVTEYEVYLSGRPVTVRLLDDGGHSTRRRYSVEAYWSDLPLDERHTANDGYSFSHDEDTISAAVSSVQWDKFASKE